MRSVCRQLIPRPPWARRLERAEAALRPAGDTGRLTMQAVRRAFAAGRPPAPEAVTPRAAVVCVLSAPPAGGGVAPVSLLLIRRATGLRANPGEIAFPGGFIEPGESPLDAALREAGEEVGLSPSDLEVLGELPMVLTGGRAVPVLPFVAAASGPLRLTPNDDEVDAVMQVSLAALAAPGCYWAEEWDREGEGPGLMHFFDLGEDVIWGATARMIDLLFARLFSPGSGGRRDEPPAGRTPPASRPTR